MGRVALVAAVVVVAAGGYWMWRSPEEEADPAAPSNGGLLAEPTLEFPVPTAESLDPPSAIDQFARGDLEADASEVVDGSAETRTASDAASDAASNAAPVGAGDGAPIASTDAATGANDAANAASEPPAEAPTTPPPARPIGNGFDGSGDDGTIIRPAAPAAASGADALTEGLQLAATDPVRARTLLSNALLAGSLGPKDRKDAADALTKIGRELSLTPVLNANDTTFFRYEVQSGDSLQKIVRKHKLGCDWRLVQRINNIKRPEAIRVGQKLKLPKGPFTAVVWKGDYRIDLCIGAGDDRVVFASLPVGLGSSNGTPTGRFRVRIGSKLLDPEWRHPVTGEYFASDDPKNPIGEHWLGLEGIDASNQELLGYGIHGTIDIDSIGQDRSLGCVRLLADDVALVWEALGDGCEVEIRP
jgi:LysM repeat protein